jgi:hypothetical protein
VEERVTGFEERMQQKQFSLNLAERQARRAEDRARWEGLNRRTRDLARDNYVFTEVRLAVAEMEGGTGDRENGGDLDDFDGGELEKDEDPGKDEPVKGKISGPLDVPLRESLRILLDWISLAPGEDETHNDATRLAD